MCVQKCLCAPAAASTAYLWPSAGSLAPSIATPRGSPRVDNLMECDVTPGIHGMLSLAKVDRRAMKHFKT